MTALNERLLHESLAIESRIAKLGVDPHVQEVWKTADLLKVIIGADIECYTYDRSLGQKIGQKGIDEKTKGLFNQIYREFCNSLCGKPYMDSRATELNPKEGDVKNAINLYLTLGERITQIADALGYDFAMGAGHWHLSIEDSGKDEANKNLLNVRKEERSRKRLLGFSREIKHDYSPFANLLRDNLTALQGLCPALFLRPSRSDKDPQRVTYTSRIGLFGELSDQRKSTIRMVGKPYPNKSLSFEMRMAHMAPYVPILMLLHAVEVTLENRTLDIADYKESTLPLLNRGDVFVQGQGTYLDYIKTTEETGYLQKNFPHLHQDLINACALSYAAFLEDKSWSITYADEDRNRVLEKLIKQYPEHLLIRNDSLAGKRLNNPSLTRS